MIRAVYHPDELRLTVTGHAGAGPKGHDLVCAAVSTLVLTLAAALHRAEIALDTEDVASGDAEVGVDLEDMDLDTLADCRLIFGTICSGLELLAESWPQFLDYRAAP